MTDEVFASNHPSEREWSERVSCYTEHSEAGGAEQSAA